MRTFILFATAIAACAAALAGFLAMETGSYGRAAADAFFALVNVCLWSFNYWIVP